MMSPNMLLVTITSNWRGSRTICMQSASTYMCCAVIFGYSALTSLKTRCHRPPAWVMALDLSHISTFAARRAVELRMRLAVFKGIADDALDALARVDVFLGGDLVGSSLLEDAAGIGINALGVFAEDDEVDVFRFDPLQWAERRVKQADRAHVGIEIHLEAHAEQNFFGVDIGLDARIAEGADEDGVEIASEHGEAVRRNGGSGRADSGRLPSRSRSSRRPRRWPGSR